MSQGQEVLIFFVVLILYTANSGACTFWITQIQKKKAVASGWTACLNRALLLSGLYFAFTWDSFGAILGMILGDGIGSYLTIMWLNRGSKDENVHLQELPNGSAPCPK
jgi:uncharacterized membrane protein YsdA (DUF1294 family)